ncbi:MAG: hypothetical protein ACLQKA_16520 [Bryobacteraceae bacterium]
MVEGLTVLMRWLHLASVACLSGGLIYGWIVAGAAAPLDPEARAKLGERMAAAFRTLVILSIAALVISGAYNLLSNPGHTLRYHIVLIVKLLLVAHIFAVAVLATQPHHARRTRLMASGAISSLIVIGIAVYLHRIF